MNLVLLYKGTHKYQIHMNVVENRSGEVHSQRLDKIDHIKTKKKKITNIKFINCKREDIHWKIIKHIICIMHAYIQCHKLVKRPLVRIS